MYDLHTLQAVFELYYFNALTTTVKGCTVHARIMLHELLNHIGVIRTQEYSIMYMREKACAGHHYSIMTWNIIES